MKILYSALKNFFKSKSFIGTFYSLKMSGFLLGFRKNYVLYDLERAFLAFLKVVLLVKHLKKKRLNILYVGCPADIITKLKVLLLNSQHYFFTSQDWVSGKLSNRKKNNLVPNLVVIYNSKKIFSSREVITYNVPLVSFISAKDDTKFVDFPIVLNTASNGARNLFLFLVKMSV